MMKQRSKPGRLIALVMAVVVGVLALSGREWTAGAMQGESMFSGPRAPELEPNLGWLNTDRPLRFDGDLKGQVVVLDFWTYCCINCIHVLDELAELERMFANDPFVVVGVHSAKFDNEQDRKNIRTAIQRYEIAHPVVVDKEMGIWSRYGARGWPTLVVIGPDGRVIGATSGEGNKELLERTIRRALEEGRAAGTLAAGPLTIRRDASVPSTSGLLFPGKVHADAAGRRLFIADSGRHRVIEASWPDGAGRSMVRRVFGGREPGFVDGGATEARFYEPQGMALSADGKRLFVADRRNHSIRAIDLASGLVTTIAGTGEQGRDRQGGRAAKRQALNSPWDLAVDGDSMFIAMAGPHQIWMMDLAKGTIAAYAGSGIEHIVDGDIQSAALAQPSGLALDGRRLYFADSEVSAVRFVDLQEGQVRTIVGKGLFEFGDRDGDHQTARLQHPLGVTMWNGKVLVADTYNNKIRVVDPVALRVGSWLGAGAGPEGSDAPTLYEPGGLHMAGEGAGARLFIADTNNHRVVMVDPATRVWVEVGLDGLDGERRAGAAPVDEEIDLRGEARKGAALTFEVAPPLPKGAHVNADAPISVRVERDGKLVAQRTFPGGTFPVEVTAAAAYVGEGDWRVEVRYAYCTVEDRTLCAPRSTAWNLSLSVRPDGTERLRLAGP